MPAAKRCRRAVRGFALLGATRARTSRPYARLRPATIPHAKNGIWTFGKVHSFINTNKLNQRYMKRSFSLMFFVLLMVTMVVSTATAQPNSKKKKKKKETTEDYFDERGSLKDRLWYGINGGGGFGGNQGISSFQITAIPMVGYKITDYWSAGPRIGLGYNYIKIQQQSADPLVVQPLSYTVAAFSRLKFLRMFFFHVEYGLESNEDIDPDGDGFLEFSTATGKIITERFNNDAFNIGLGYNAGDGGLGYEIGLFYKALEPKNSDNLPFDIRVGLTYKF